MNVMIDSNKKYYNIGLRGRLELLGSTFSIPFFWCPESYFEFYNQNFDLALMRISFHPIYCHFKSVSDVQRMKSAWKPSNHLALGYLKVW